MVLEEGMADRTGRVCDGRVSRILVVGWSDLSLSSEGVSVCLQCKTVRACSYFIRNCGRLPSFIVFEAQKLRFTTL